MFLVSLAVRNDRQLAIWPTPDQMKETRSLLFVGIGKCCQPRVELVLRDVLRVIIRMRRFLFWYALDEWLLVIEPRPWTIVDEEIVQPLTARGGLIGD